jgi:hypothetical protein
MLRDGALSPFLASGIEQAAVANPEAPGAAIDQ